MNRLCLILFGPPGSGKGTQAKLLRESRGLAHISTGDMLRERAASGVGLGSEVAAMMLSGGLVPDKLVNQMVEERIEQPDATAGFILDGYPRTVNQARLLAGVLQTKGVDPLVIHLKVDYNVIIARLSGRRQCPKCGTLYGVSTNALTVSEVCVNDGSGLVIRDDDREDVVGERLRAYERQTTPVLEFLRNAGYTCYDVDAGLNPPRVIAKEIEALVDAKYGKVATVAER
jgi:adenylate kinase